MAKNYFYICKLVETAIPLFISYWLLFLVAMYPSYNLIYLLNKISLALVPLSIISTLVKQPIVRHPDLSIYLASFSASEVDMSELAGIAHKIIVLGSIIYLRVS